jgi:hypothetical protein
MTQRARTVLLHLAFSFLGQAALAATVLGQVPDSLTFPASLQEGTPVTQEESAGGISPRGAFLRGLALPGWGHAKVGSYSRGGFYIAAQSATGFMLFKTQSRHSRVRNRLDLLESVERARLEAEGVTNPAAVEDALGQNPLVADLRALEEVRNEQREDWIALGVFLVLLSGVDAYVSAHLSNFPVPVEIGAPAKGGIEVGFSLPARFF